MNARLSFPEETLNRGLEKRLTQHFTDSLAATDDKMIDTIGLLAVGTSKTIEFSHTVPENSINGQTIKNIATVDTD